MPPEGRIDQIMQRLDGAYDTGFYDTNPAKQSGQSFKAMASMMQSQMMAQAMMGDDDNSSSGIFGNNSNPMMMLMSSQGQGMMNPMSMMMGMDPMMMAMMPNASTMNQSSGIYAPTSPNAQFPVDGQVSSYFGERQHPIAGHADFHHGVDIAAPLGAPIKAPWNGKVIFVGHADGFGEKTVIIAHPDTEQEDGKILYSVFGHNNDVYVNVGDEINQGQVFASVGDDGDSTGPHLHWETRLAEPGLYGKQIFHKQLSYALDPLKFV